jgi:glycosyltransferase involved in cell wall biosynthesis
MDVYADSLVRGLKVVRPDWEIIERSPAGSTNGLQKYRDRYWQYPRTLKHLEADIFHIIDHSDGYLSYWLKRYRKPNVITCHDLINLIKPETFQGQARFPLISMTAWRLAIQSMKEADRIIAVSSHTKKDAIEHLNISSHNITVIPNAVDANFRLLPSEDIQAFRCERELFSDTLCLLNVGSNNLRKNVSTILQVVASLKGQGLPVRFWKVGADFNAEQIDFIKVNRLDTSVKYLGEPDRETLVEIYNAADVLLAPSLYEGFGLTILEAMACGTAIIAANATSLPEVAGDAAILVEPLDIKGMETAIHQLDKDLKYRQELVQKGLERVKQFTWEHTAEQVACVYEQVLAHSKRY